jgi:hypothetical protein
MRAASKGFCAALADSGVLAGAAEPMVHAMEVADWQPADDDVREAARKLGALSSWVRALNHAFLLKYQVAAPRRGAIGEPVVKVYGFIEAHLRAHCSASAEVALNYVDRNGDTVNTMPLDEAWHIGDLDRPDDDGSEALVAVECIVTLGGALQFAVRLQLVDGFLRYGGTRMSGDGMLLGLDHFRLDDLFGQNARVGRVELARNAGPGVRSLKCAVVEARLLARALEETAFVPFARSWRFHPHALIDAHCALSAVLRRAGLVDR